MSKNNDLPENISLDLDALEKERPVEPFRSKIGGKVVTFTDPRDIDWKDLLEIENPAEFFRHAVSEEDKVHLREVKIEGWRFGKLIDSYLTHFGLDKMVGKGGGSPF